MSNIISNVAFEAVSCAAAVAIIAHPIGAVGGAIFGAIHGATNEVIKDRISVESLAGKHLLTIAKIAIAWKLAAVCGVPMGFGAAVAISLAPVVAALAIKIIQNLCNGHRDPLSGILAFR